MNTQPAELPQELEEPEDEDEIIFTHAGASEWLWNHGYVMSTGTLMNMSSAGTGPKHERWGRRVAYRVGDLWDWAEARWGKESPDKE